MVQQRRIGRLIEQRGQQANIAAGQDVAGKNFRDRGVKAFAGEIEQRVAQLDGQQDMATPVAITRIKLAFIANRRSVRRGF